MNKSLYEILQVSPVAGIDVIDAAFARLRQRHEGNEVKSKAIKLAYDTLSDPIRRASYDRRFTSRMVPSSSGYRSDFSTSGNAGWRGPAFSKEIILVALIAAATMIIMSVGSSRYISYAMHEKDTIVAHAAVNNDSRRVDNERAIIERAMDIQERHTEIEKETLERQVELAHLEQQRRTMEIEATIAHRSEQLQLQRDQQQFAMWQQQRAEHRIQEDRARILNRDRLDRERRELCRMERNHYNVVLSC